MANKRHLTKREIDSLTIPEGKDRIRVYDDEIHGYGVTVYPTGRKSFFLEYGPARRRRRMKLGDYGPLTPEAARKAALDAKGKIIAGGDPLADRDRIRKMPTFRVWADSYMDTIRSNRKDPRKIELFLEETKAKWGNRLLSEITVEDVKGEFKRLTRSGGRAGQGVPIKANRWLAAVRACLEAARKESYIQVNPASLVTQNRENRPRNRVITDKEMERLLKAVEQLKDPPIEVAFHLLVETGARLSEVLNARWQDVDLDEGVWYLPDTKSGKSQYVPLARKTAARLRNLKEKGGYIVPGKNRDQPRYDLRKPWDKVKDLAGFKDITIHDIRRTFGLDIARRSGIHVASKLLRHSDIRVTERVYAPLGLDDLRDALESRDAEVLHLRQKAEGDGEEEL